MVTADIYLIVIAEVFVVVAGALLVTLTVRTRR